MVNFGSNPQHNIEW